MASDLSTDAAEKRLADKHELEEELEEQLERDDALDKYREKRLLEMKAAMDKIEEMKRRDHGAYTEITVEKEFLKLTTTTKRVVAHFAHKQFRRCQILDAHLKVLAVQHFNTKFVKIDVDSAPFFVEKLNIKVLPCLISFIGGTIVDRLVGFEALGNTDVFKTEVLERRLLNAGVIDKTDMRAPAKQSKPIFGSLGEEEEDLEEFDT